MPSPLGVVVNATSGKGHSEADMQGLRSLFEAAGLEAQIHLARSGEEVSAVARRSWPAGAMAP